MYVDIDMFATRFGKKFQEMSTLENYESLNYEIGTMKSSWFSKIDWQLPKKIQSLS